MAESLSHLESEKPQDPPEMDKKEILKGSAPRKRRLQIIPHKEKCVKNPSKQRKDSSTFHDLKHQSWSETKLDLSGRGLRNLDEANLSGLYHVVELDLSNNPLSPVWEYLGLPRLKKLDLSSCGLKEYDFGFLHACYELEEVNLSNNPFGPNMLHLGCCSPVYHLKKLDLSGCGLKRLPCGFLEDFDQLEELNLSNNPFGSTMHRLRVIWYLRHLKKLNLSGCCLTELVDGLQECTNLQELNLSNNFLDHLDILQKLKSKSKPSESSWLKSDTKLLEPVSFVRIVRGPKVIKVVLEDAVYTRNEGVWSVEWHKDVSSTSSAESSTKQSTDFFRTKIPSVERQTELTLRKTDEDAKLKELAFTSLEKDLSNKDSELKKLTLRKTDVDAKLKDLAFTSLEKDMSSKDSELKKKTLGPSTSEKVVTQAILSDVRFEEYDSNEEISCEFRPIKRIKRKHTIENYHSMHDLSTSSEESSPEQSTSRFVTKIPSAESQTKKILGSSTCGKLFSLAMLSVDPFEENDSDEKIYREFCQIKRINKKLTIENYLSMLFSVKIAVGVLIPVDRPVEYILQRKATCGSSLKVVNAELLTIGPTLHRPSLKMPSLVLESITLLKNGVLRLFKWLMGQTYVEESRQWQSIWRPFETAFEKASGAFFSESLSTADRLLASKLRIISKILESFSKPEAAALHCLQLLQELHNLRETRETFSLPDGKKTILRHERDLSSEAVHKINKILFEFVRMFLKPPPTAEEWPATIQLDGKIYNPLNDYRFFKSGLFNVSFLQELETLQYIISRQGSQDRCGNDAKDCAPAITSCGKTVAKSITFRNPGGFFSVPVASAFLVFPPNAVQGEVTLTCSRVKYEDCDVKPRDGEAFVSRILKIEPEGMVFSKPVTIFLSHSVSEDQDFLDFYELVVINLNSGERQELKTERISCVEDVPIEIRNSEILSDDFPFAKATIYETCTLVAAARFKSDQVLVPTNRIRVFSKKYGETKEVKIKFPAGVTEKIVCLTVQLFPADAVLNRDVYLDDNLVCAPIIKVSGQTESFLKPVDVELVYSHNDVANIEEGFLPVGEKTQFTTEYGLLLRSHKKTESKSKCQETLNECNEVYIERLRKDQLKFSFSVEHFCNLCPTAKKCASAQLPNVEETCIVNQFLSLNLKYPAFVWAVHYCEYNLLYAVLAPKVARRDLEAKWKIAGKLFGSKLKPEEKIYVCVPLESGTSHLPLDDCVLRFDDENEYELPNKTNEDVHLDKECMYFLVRKCIGRNHDLDKDGRVKVLIHNFEEKSSKENDQPVNQLLPKIEQRQENDVCASDDVSHNRHITSQNEAATEQRHDELALDNKSLQAPKNSSDLEDVLNKSIQKSHVINDVVSRCEAFEKMIETAAQEELKINRASVKDPKGGKISNTMNIVGPMATVIVGLACGITIVVGFATLGIGSFFGAAVAGATVVVLNVDKRSKQSLAEQVVEIEEANVRSYLNCIVKEVAKELSHIFEYQLLQLKDERQVEVLAECAVDLMLKLEVGDKFDRNTLLKKVLRDGKIDRKDLLTRNEGDKWSAPNVFRKPGLRRLIKGKDGVKFEYLVNPKRACNAQKYGYRSQFLEMIRYGDQSEQGTTKGATGLADAETSELKKLCKECSDHYDNCCGGEYFVESDVDLEYDRPRQEHSTYYPVHVLVQCPEVLHCFIGKLQEERSLANFLKKMFELPNGHLVRPVYRPHSPSKVPHLTGADLTGADFSHSDFTNSSLEGCDFTKCVMLFAKLENAAMTRSTFKGALISHSNLMRAKVDHCTLIKTSVLYSRMNNADLRGMANFGDICWDGSNVDTAIVEETAATNNTAVNHLIRMSRNSGQTQRPVKLAYV